MFEVALRFDNKHREEDGKIIEKSSIFVLRIQACLISGVQPQVTTFS